jgi:hypothetical protein
MPKPQAGGPPLVSCCVRWVPCHHGMACPQDADGSDSLHIGRVATNILTTQSQTHLLLQITMTVSLSCTLYRSLLTTAHM